MDAQLREALSRIPDVTREGMSVAEARRVTRDRARLVPHSSEAVQRVYERTLPTRAGGIRARVYAPGGADLPMLLYLHGGGWVLSDLDGPDALCRTLANRAGCVVVSLDYPLAPEHKFPAALEASHAATSWLAEHGADLGADPTRIAIGGESAGGNLAAAVALTGRDRGGPRLAFQLLLVPVIDHSFDTASYRENAEGYRLTRAEMMWFWRHYLRAPADGADPYASPLRAADLRRLPPAFIVTAELDPLRDEGEAYARRLAEAGVTVACRRYDGMTHGFLGFSEVVDVARRALDDIVGALRAALQ